MFCIRPRRESIFKCNRCTWVFQKYSECPNCGNTEIELITGLNDEQYNKLLVDAIDMAMKKFIREGGDPQELLEWKGETIKATVRN